MPLYRCKAPTGSVPIERRLQIAIEFTRIHSELTGAPPSFVHVHFVDIDIDDGARAYMKPYEIHGTIRAGRSKDVKTQLISRRAIINQHTQWSDRHRPARSGSSERIARWSRNGHKRFRLG